MSLRFVCAVAAGLTAGCSPGTAFLLEVDTTAASEVEQLHVTGYDGDRVVFGPATRPERPDGNLSPKESVRVLLPQELSDRDLRVRVDGLSGGKVSSSAQTVARPVKNEEVRLSLRLEAGEAACGACDGCCDGARCLGRSLAACGAGGVTCFACDPALADSCAPQGRCQCGDGPACDPLSGADRCENGKCQCGSGNPCPAGTQCDNGICRCTAASCGGCCSGNECLPGTLPAACGSAGAACETCAPAEACSLGACVTAGG